MFSYRTILKKAMSISLRHKYLWLFGFFTAFLMGSGQYNLAFGSVNKELEGNFFVGFAKILNSDVSGANVLTNLNQAFATDPLLASVALVFLLMGLILILVLVWFVVVSQIALINNSAEIIKKDKKTSIRQGIDAGIVNFWSVLGVNLIGKGFICFLVAFISLPLFFLPSSNTVSIGFLYIFLFVIFLPVALIISFMMQYASAYVILKKEKFIDALSLSWSLFLKNWLISIEMAFILLFVQLLVILTSFLVILVVFVPYIFFSQILAIILASLFPSLVVFNFLLVLGLILSVVFIVLIGSALMVFKMSAWTNIFIELDSRKKTLSKLIRVFAK